MTNIILTSPAGQVLCSARPGNLAVNVADRPHMRRAMAEGQPVVSGFVVGRVSGQGNLQLVVPVRDASGSVFTFVVVGLAASNLLAGFESAAPLHPALLLFDRDGTLVQRMPESAELRPGVSFAQSELFARRAEAAGAQVEMRGLDGVRRSYVMREVRYRNETVGWIAAGADQAALQAAARNALWRDLSIVLLLSALVVALAALAWRPLVSGRYRELLEVASRVSAGSHHSRVHVAVADDLTPVESAVNTMLDAIERDRVVLAASESRYRSLFENNLDGVLLTKPGGQVLAANPAACDMLGWSEDELVQVRRESLVDTTDPRLGTLLRERGTAGRAIGELRFRRSDGSTFEAEVTSSIYRDTHGQKLTCLVIRDITQRLQARAEILQLNAQLEERVRQRTRELEQAYSEMQAFTYSVSHDLRAPVATITAFSQQLEKHNLIEDPKGRHYVERIAVAGRRMSALIDGLLALSQINRADLVATDLDISELAGEAVQECRDSEADRKVSVRIEPGMRAHGDRRLVQALLDNLVRNAWKFTRDRETPAIVIESAGTEPDGAAVVCVRDNGTGFDEAHADHLFEAFHRLHREDEFPGLGIGLATVQRIVQRHGGRVWGRSPPGEGAAFYFSLGPRPAT